MAEDEGPFIVPKRSWRGVILAAALGVFLPDVVQGQCGEGIFKDGFDPGLVINEVDYDEPGIDNEEFVEIFNPGAAPVSLAGVLLQLIEGTGPSTYLSTDLSALGTLAPAQYLVVGTAVVPNVNLVFPTLFNIIQNGPTDGLRLFDTTFCVQLDALAYEGAVPGLVEGNALPATVADSNTVSGSLIRNPNGSDTDDAATDWAFTGTPTPGSANTP